MYIVCVCMHVCIYVCVHACMNVHMFMCVKLCLQMFAQVYVCKGWRLSLDVWLASRLWDPLSLLPLHRDYRYKLP